MFAEYAQLGAGSTLARIDDRPVPVDGARGGEPGPGRRAACAVGWRSASVVTSRSASSPRSRPTTRPIIMAFQKLIPALMAGNSVILRPSPLTPDLLAGLRGGGRGGRAAAPACSASWSRTAPPAPSCSRPHPAVDMVSFTGSTAVGRQILAQAAPTVKRVALELGGKSAQIYLPDAVDRVGAGAVAVVAMTAGPGVRGGHPDARAARTARTRCSRRSAAAYAAITVGPPTDPSRHDGSGHQRAASASAASATSRWPRSTAARSSSVAAGPAGFDTRLLLRADGARPARQREPGGAGGDLRSGARRDRLRRHRRRGADRQRQHLRPVGSGVRRRRGRRDRGRPPAADRRGQRQHRRVQRLRAERRLQAERPRPRAGPDGIRAFQEVKHLAIGELPG